MLFVEGMLKMTDISYCIVFVADISKLLLISVLTAKSTMVCCLHSELKICHISVNFPIQIYEPPNPLQVKTWVRIAVCLKPEKGASVSTRGTEAGQAGLWHFNSELASCFLEPEPQTEFIQGFLSHFYFIPCACKSTSLGAPWARGSQPLCSHRSSSMRFEGSTGSPGVLFITLTLPEEQLPAWESQSCQCKPGTASTFFLRAYTHTQAESGAVLNGGHHLDGLRVWNLLRRPHLETGAAEVDCLDPQPRVSREPLPRTQVKILLEKPPDYWDKLPGCRPYQDTWNCGSCGARASEGIWIWGAHTGLGRWVGKKADHGPGGGKDGCPASGQTGVGTGLPPGYHKPQSKGNGPFGWHFLIFNFCNENVHLQH